MIKNIKTKLISYPCVFQVNLMRKISYSFSSQLPSGKSFISRLESRSLLVMQGPETYKLLQGLTTNDMNLLANKPIQGKRGQSVAVRKVGNDRVSLYTLFLSPKGKIITDAFIYKPKIFENGKKTFRQEQLWIDVHSSTKRQLFFHLKKYMWKKQVQLIEIDSEADSHKPSVYAGYNHISTISNYLEEGTEISLKGQQAREQEYSNLMMFDPRGGNYGRRILCMQEELGVPVSDFRQMPESMYEDFERAIGFTPTPLTKNKLPFQFNYDFLNAISFKKGCYLGQEIVSRSYFTGIVRRRVFPFIIDPKHNLTETRLKEIRQGCQLLDQNNEQIGKIIYYEKQKTGLALAPYLSHFPHTTTTPLSDKITDSEVAARSLMSIRIAAPFQGALYCPFQQTLQKYVTDTRSKQKTLEELDI